MKFAIQERIPHSTDMGTPELSGWYNGDIAISGGYSGIEEVQDITTNTTHGIIQLWGMAMVLN